MPDPKRGEFDPKFWEYMLNRVKTGAPKYGGVKKAKFLVNFMASASARARMLEYEKTGNTEFLVDAANFLMLEFMEPNVEGAEFRELH